ncbi:MAG: sugar ABC transporter ATP-binding protein [Anaerolineae bacterium]|nr:sugar ABC transporter ATP-binding protein [Anaerolineae bacterium]
MPSNETILDLENIDKRFGGVHALNNVSFSVLEGEVHAIVGENGAGKSTLMKILAGNYKPDTGRILLSGKEVEFNNPHQAHMAGISIIYQEFYCFPSLSVVANVFAGKEIIKNIFLDEKEMRKRVCDVLNRMGVKIDPDATARDLSVADQQIIEIAKALVYESKIVIMDEPNSALTDKETKALFEIINRMKKQGITILYISHRLEEVFQICDRITVLRDGHFMGTWEKTKTNIPFIISQMIGRKLDEAFPKRSTIHWEATPILKVKNLSLENSLDNVNFEIRAGEVLGFAGLEGSGIRELFHILFGLQKFTSGEILYQGNKQDYSFSDQAIKAGWGLIPANRRDHGLIMRWTVKENITLVILKRLLNAMKLIRRSAVDSVAADYITKLRISAGSSDKIALDLSGGNQQKVVISKWLATNPRILLLDDPTRGIDVGAKSEIYNLIQDLSKQGLAILFNSSEIDEVIGLSHRILVVRQGKIIKEFNHQEAEKSEVLRFVSGNFDYIEDRKFEKQNC